MFRYFGHKLSLLLVSYDSLLTKLKCISLLIIMTSHGEIEFL